MNRTFGGVSTMNATASATSSGCRAPSSLSDRSEKLVATEPGFTTETLTPESRSSSMSDSVNAIAACFVAA